MLALLIITASLVEVWPLFTRCHSDRDCPVGGFCLKDECPHCICPRGHSVTNFVRDMRVIKICAKELTVNVGDDCPRLSLTCPDGSHCDDVMGTCQCDKHLVMDNSRMFCRPAIFGEVCSHHTPCTDSLGLICTGSPPLCQCMRSLRSPDAWAKHVTERWQFERVDAIVQQCVIRAIGERCSSDEHCASIGGSGAFCAPCGLCQCKQDGHVPNIQGHRCGLPLLLGDRCSHVMASVCDGTRGLQCGHMCDFYKDDLQRIQNCQCSQMHILDGGICKPKRKGKKCRTDLDCYLLRGGFGVCENKRCTIAGNTTSFRPHKVNKKCHKVNSDNTVNKLTSEAPVVTSQITTTVNQRITTTGSEVIDTVIDAKQSSFADLVTLPITHPPIVFNVTKYDYQRDYYQSTETVLETSYSFNETNSSIFEDISQGKYTSDALRQTNTIALFYFTLCFILFVIKLL